MNKLFHRHKRILALELRSGRFGYAVVEESGSLLDWGVRVRRDGRNGAAELARRVQILTDAWKPAKLLVVTSTAVKKMQIRSVTRAVHVAVRVLKPGALKGAFEVREKHAIAEAAAKHFPELEYLLPARRKFEDSEHYRMPMFGALAMAAAYLSGRLKPQRRSRGLQPRRVRQAHGKR